MHIIIIKYAFKFRNKSITINLSISSSWKRWRYIFILQYTIETRAFPAISNNLTLALRDESHVLWRGSHTFTDFVSHERELSEAESTISTQALNLWIMVRMSYVIRGTNTIERRNTPVDATRRSATEFCHFAQRDGARTGIQYCVGVVHGVGKGSSSDGPTPLHHKYWIRPRSQLFQTKYLNCTGHRYSETLLRILIFDSTNFLQKYFSAPKLYIYIYMRRKGFLVEY